MQKKNYNLRIFLLALYQASLLIKFSKSIFYNKSCSIDIKANTFNIHLRDIVDRK